ncbi:MAG: aspartate racemase [Desulfitibacter sp. BRH_c19]|nr:MAG: aspartate racemase [Desulfitibacter sp. BRH_c19]
MKKIGLIGGMSWESSVEYYRLINEEVKLKLGGLHSAECLLYSVDFDKIEFYMRNDQWDSILQILVAAAKTLENGGADFIILCTNTMHKLAEQIQKEITVALLHIADATADEITKAKIKKVGLLGTRPTMEQNFYRNGLEEKEIQVLIPNEIDREIVHDIIFKELCLGTIKQESRLEFKRIIEKLVLMGADGIILGCTEIPLLVKKEDSKVPLFDTTYIHAIRAVEKSLNII